MNRFVAPGFDTPSFNPPLFQQPRANLSQHQPGWVGSVSATAIKQCASSCVVPITTSGDLMEHSLPRAKDDMVQDIVLKYLLYMHRKFPGDNEWPRTPAAFDETFLSFRYSSSVKLSVTGPAEIHHFMFAESGFVMSLKAVLYWNRRKVLATLNQVFPTELRALDASSWSPKELETKTVSRRFIKYLDDHRAWPEDEPSFFKLFLDFQSQTPEGRSSPLRSADVLNCMYQDMGLLRLHGQDIFWKRDVVVDFLKRELATKIAGQLSGQKVMTPNQQPGVTSYGSTSSNQRNTKPVPLAARFSSMSVSTGSAGSTTETAANQRTVIESFLAFAGLSTFLPSFQHNDVDTLEVMHTLSDQDLLVLGLNTLGLRLKFRNALAKFHEFPLQ